MVFWGEKNSNVVARGVHLLSVIARESSKTKLQNFESFANFDVGR